MFARRVTVLHRGTRAERSPAPSFLVVACVGGIVAVVSRPTRFEHFQYLGDKRTQVVYDLDLADGNEEVSAAIEELLASEQFAAFGPDTLAEARNRGYRPHRSIRANTN